ncbi:MAG: DivIVA domain-containing protein [Bacteroidetes bacterium]|nr:DivIVA domain-containing protein [Bacteroidota bacterium]
MKLTPLDIRKQEFKKVMRGYDPVEIETFMEMTANEFEELIRSQKDMRDRVIELEVQLKDYRQIEKTLQQTLLQAQETTGKAYEAARKESELITREAEQKAAAIIAQAHVDLAQLKKDLQELSTRKESLVHQLRVILSAELDLLKTLELGTAEGLVEPSPAGTGKAAIDLDLVARNIDHD